jgi:hypothetical protein
VYDAQTEPWELLEALGKHGYRVYDLYGLRRNDLAQLKWCDALFTSEKVRELASL